MKKLGILTLIFLLSATLTAAISPVKMFKIEASFTEKGKASIEDINITKTRRTSSSLYETNNNFSLRLKSKKETVKEGPIPLSFSSPIDTFNSTERRARKENATKIFFFRYRKSIERIQILNNGEVVASRRFTDALCKNNNVCTSYCEGKEVDVDCTCGDNICQKDLNEKELCSQDCSYSDSKNESSDNRSVNPGTKEVVDQSYSIYILGLIAVVAIIILIFFLSGKVKIEG
ncbi:MAG: hypothetical protein ABEJ87_01550 [Candidatus Nanohalobium sp.]